MMRRDRIHSDGACRRPRSRGLLLPELLIALAITAMVALGVASMIGMISSSTMAQDSARSTLLRAHSIKVRLSSYFTPALNVLDIQHAGESGPLGKVQETAVAIWLLDSKPIDNLHLSELRVLWHDPATGVLRLERVQFPEEWPELLKEDSDVVVPFGSDYFGVMKAQRGLGYTTFDVIGGGLTAMAIETNLAAPADSDRITISMSIENGSETHDLLMTFGLPNHQEIN